MEFTNMKNFFNSLLILFGTILVSIVIFPIGFVYSLGYNIYMTFIQKDWTIFFKLLWRIINGILTALGYIILQTCIGIDMIWNVFGELFEDCFTAKENTDFAEAGITVSSSTGHLEVDSELNTFGKSFSKLLSLVFGQKQHAIDSWKLDQAKKELKKQYGN